MLKLIKIGIYALAGYALYEFVLGIMEPDTNRPNRPMRSTESSQPGRSTVRSGGGLR